jgi:hypothetical protein
MSEISAMRPSWNDAPEWANYLTCDNDGQWYWYEEKPIFGGWYWYDKSNGKSEEAFLKQGKNSLEKRPNISSDEW